MLSPRETSVRAWWTADSLHLDDGAPITTWRAIINPITGDCNFIAATYPPTMALGACGNHAAVRFTNYVNSMGSDNFGLTNLVGASVGTVISVFKAGASATVKPWYDAAVDTGMGIDASTFYADNEDTGGKDRAQFTGTDFRGKWVIGLWLHTGGTLYCGVYCPDLDASYFTRSTCQSVTSGDSVSLAGQIQIAGGTNPDVADVIDIAELAFWNIALDDTTLLRLLFSLCYKYGFDVDPTAFETSWFDLTSDVQINDNISIQRGNDGTTQRDRVAQTGTMSFTLDNSASNLGGVLGYYSPRNANCLPGWRLGAPVRCRVSSGPGGPGEAKTVFLGTIQSINPTSGKYAERKVAVECVDWMEEAASTKIRGLSILENKRSDEVFTALIEAMEHPPFAGYQAQIGGDTYPIVFDNTLDSEINVMSEFQRLAQSELGRIFVRRDGVLVFEGRHKRPNLFTISATLTDEEIDSVDSDRGREEVLNRAEVEVHPRRVDTAATTVLFSLANKPKIERKVRLEINAPYRDPAAKATRVGGKEMVTPVSGTDYTFNTLENGTGQDISAQLTVTPTFGANAADVNVLNQGPLDGYLTKLQLRGKGIYSYETVKARADSAASKEAYGEKTFSLDMPYQDDIAVAKDAADFVVAQSKDVLTPIRGVTFWANRTAQLMSWALDVDVSSRVSVVETMIGNAPFVPIGEDLQQVTPDEFFVNAVRLEIGERGLIRCTWTLESADPFQYWVLERAGFTELDETTRLAYGSFQVGWVLEDAAYGILGSTTRVNQ